MSDRLPAQRHSPTSVAAAEAAKPLAATYRAILLEHIRSRGIQGVTDEEAQIDLGMDQNTQRPRRVELVRAGLVRDSGRTRRTRSGRQAVVWVAT